MDRRMGKAHWGAGQPRVRTSPANWREPLKWNAKAKADGIRRRVFCASLADVFDHEVDPQWRADLLLLIRDCPDLDWLLLTKRPHLILDHLEAAGVVGNLSETLPQVWIGTTVENQETANERIPHLQRVPARVRFLSCEPLVGPVTLPMGRVMTGFPKHITAQGHAVGAQLSIHWVICGGESGPKARPMHPEWARSLRDQCKAAGVPYFFKQWGEWSPIDQPWEQDSPSPTANNERWLNLAGGHGFHGDAVWRMRRVGKAASGHLLDGEVIQQIPEGAK